MPFMMETWCLPGGHREDLSEPIDDGPEANQVSGAQRAIAWSRRP